MRTKLVFINFITDALPQIIIFFLGIFKSKLFIDLLGNDELGLYQLYGQIIAYLVLLEGGVGSALLFRLYKPISEKDYNKINSLMNAAKIIFNIIGCIIILLGIIVSFNINIFIKDSIFPNSYLQMCFLLYLASQAIYYFILPYRVLFEAEQKRYIPNVIFQVVTVLKSIIEITIVSLGFKLPVILISLIICSFASNFLIYYFYKKEHKHIDKKVKKDFTMLKDVKDLFVNTLGNVLTNNIDVLIISKVIGLKFVVIYSTYNYFVEAIKQFVDKITGATMSGIGDLLVNNKKRATEVFLEFNQFTFYLAMVIAIPFFTCINQFINLFYQNKITTTFYISLFFTIILFYQIIRIPLKVFIFSSGKFKEVKNLVILEIIINLSLSLLLVSKYNISGVLLATIISLIIADFIPKPYILYNKVFESKDHPNFYKKSIINIVYILVQGFIFYSLFPKIYTNIFVCILFGIIIGILNLLLVSLYFYVTKQYGFINRFKLLQRRKEK